MHRNNTLWGAAFMSRTERELLHSKASGSVQEPGPGSYDICEKWTSSSPRAAQAPFKSTTERMTIPKCNFSNPGPGAYNPHQPRKSHVEKKGFTRKHYLCIATPATEMPREQPSPGPGYYDIVNYQEHKKSCVSSSMFVSSTERWKSERSETSPGPGSYDPRKQTKQSFMFNRGEKWV